VRLFTPRSTSSKPKLAGKITGMILEMDNHDLFDLISDDAALQDRVDKALRVYDDYIKANPGSN
jgi:polyadenylate-binding protein